MFQKSDYVRDEVDFVLLGLLATAFGLHVVAHVMLVIGLVKRRPWWRGVVACVVPPLAPFWGYEARLRGPVALWIVSLIMYVASLTAAAL
jgi:hypothetical protein